MTLYIRHANHKGGVNNLTIAEAFNHLVFKYPFIATSTKGEKQALINLKRQVKALIIREDRDILRTECVNPAYMRYRVNKLYKYLITK